MFSHLRTRNRGAAARKAVLTLETLEDRMVPTLLGNSLFPADNPWNQQITNAPVASNSAAIINNIIGQQGSDGRLHPDFGQDYNNSSALYGIPYNVVHGNSTQKVHVVIDAYPGESDLQNAPIPANPVIEGDFQNGPNVGVNNRGDSHLIVYDEDNNVAYEFYRASRPSENSDGQWHADQESVWDMKTDTFRTLGYTSADAAGLAILPGLVRPDEGLPVSQGGQGVINHAIRFTLQNSIILDQFLYPASHVANSGSNAAVQPPMGARFRLKAGVDLSLLNPESRVVAQAMKDYGMIVADNGSNFFFSGASYSVNASNAQTLTWSDNDIQDSTHGLKSLHFSDFEVVSLAPVVTGLSATSGAAGQTVTVTGQNFSGAAGRLQVNFGNTPATNVTVLDDGHVTATVPAGSGTVDVRVQSGVSDPNDSQNINSPVFGYGTSAVSSADRFSYGSTGGNAPPTVATPAAASPATVTGKTTALSVLGADDGGEANLTYTWAMTTGPTGAQPTFSANGTNAAKNSTVTFDRVGSYTFQVTITDAGGLTAASSASVSVVATLTSLKLTPTSATVAPGGTVQFTATGYDQFALVLAQQPKFTWSVVSGPGRVNSAGLYTASSKTGTATVQASSGGVSARATVTVKRSGTLSGKSLVNPLV
jgi:plastocyanin